VGPSGESTAAAREEELARLRLLAEAAEAWARWRRRGLDTLASAEETELLAALDRLPPRLTGSTPQLYPQRWAEPD